MSWIGVDLDGTLAHYADWQGPDFIGKPISPMVERVKNWLANGRTVKIFTARMHGHGMALIGGGVEDVKTPIEQWCLKHIGQVLEVTNSKDFGMIELWDDRCVQVEANTGTPVASCKDRKRKPYKTTSVSDRDIASAMGASLETPAPVAQNTLAPWHEIRLLAQTVQVAHQVIHHNFDERELPKLWKMLDVAAPIVVKILLAPCPLDQAIRRRQDYDAALDLLREAHERMGNTAFPSLASRIATFLKTAPAAAPCPKEEKELGEKEP